MRKTKRNHKNIVAIIAMVVLLAFLVAGGTIAWLTRTSSLTNTFTVGSFTTPTTFPNDPTDQTDPEDVTAISIDGNLYEPSWDATEEHKLIPSASFAKDPYVGIGAGSEDGVVYVNVVNNFSEKVYFSLNQGWEPVLGHVVQGSLSGTYTSGLFKYVAGLTADADKDVWTTTPLFSSVVTDEAANTSDFTPAQGNNHEIVVSSFLHQAKDDQGNAIDSATIQAAAIAAFSN